MKAISNLFTEIKGSTKHKTFKTYRDKRKIVIEKEKVTLPYVRSTAQGEQRNLFKEAVEDWKALTKEEKEEYNEQAKPYRLTGYQFFIKQYLLNPPLKYIWYKVTINNTGNSNTLTDYTVKITISNDNQFFTDCNGAKEHIRLTDADKSTELKYWIEAWDSNNKNATIWVKVPQIPASSNKIIYIKIDNELTTDASNGEDTFLFFDDASTNKSNSYIFRDIHKSGQTGSLSYDANNKRYAISWSSADNNALVINSNFNDAEIEIRFRTPSNISSNYQFGAIIRLSSSGLYWIRANAATSPDTLQIYKGPTQPSQSETQLVTTNYSGNVIATNTNYTFKARAYGSNLYCWTSLENKEVSATDTAYTSGEWGIFCGYDISSIYFNFIKVRKYTSPDPTTSYQKET